MTSSDVTAYFETFPSDRIELALQVESDRMANAVFDREETESERTVIISEREGSENSYFWLLNEEVQAAAFRVHSYHHPTIGWKSDLETMTRDSLYNHYRTFYTPNNAVAVAVGDFDTERMLARIDHHFGQLPMGPAVPVVSLAEPKQQAERRILVRGNDPTGYYLQCFHAPAATHADFFPMVVMDAVLGGAKGMGLFGDGTNNRSNRLYRALVDSELAVGAGCGFRPTSDPHLFSVYATLAPGVPHQAIEETIWAELAKIQQDGVSNAELDKAIKQTKAQFAYSSESVTFQAYWLGFSEVVASLEWLDGWLDSLAAVTSDDVQRIAQSYFARAKQTVGWYIPEEPDGTG
jgi:zinc protease